MLHLLIYNVHVPQPNKCVAIIDTIADIQSTDKPSWIKTCKYLLAHFVAYIQGKYDEYDDLYILFDRYAIPKSLKAATRHLWLCDSYPLAYHSTDTTNISNVPLKKQLSHTATKDELTVFLSIKLMKFSKENKLYTVARQHKAEASHRA